MLEFLARNKHYFLCWMGWWLMVAPLACIVNLNRIGPFVGLGPNFGNDIRRTPAYIGVTLVVTACGYCMWFCSLIAWGDSVSAARLCRQSKTQEPQIPGESNVHYSP